MPRAFIDFNFYKGKDPSGESLELRGSYEVEGGPGGSNPDIDNELHGMMLYVFYTLDNLGIPQTEVTVRLKSEPVGVISREISSEDLELLALELQDQIPDVRVVFD